MITKDRLKKLPRGQKEDLLEVLELKSRNLQKSKLESYNNADIIGPDKVHKIQLQFHQDLRKTRLFLGGNRCLAKDSLVYAPNLRKIPIQDLKVGDIVLAVDPETLSTLPCPVEAIYDNGVQDTALWRSHSRDCRLIRELWATPGHHILTEKGLQEAGEIEAYTAVTYPEDLYYAGNASPYAYLMGLIIGSLQVVSGKTLFYLSSRDYRLAVRHCINRQVDGYIKKQDNGKCEAYGALGEYLKKYSEDTELFFKEAPYTWNNESLRDFLSAWLPHKMIVYKGLFSVNCQSPLEMRFVNGALKALGCAVDTGNQKAAYKKTNLLIYSPFDVLRIATKLRLPKWMNDELLKWAAPRASYCNNTDLKFLKVEHYWRLQYKTQEPWGIRKQQVYDIKLAGGHNMYVANGFIVGNSGKTEAGAVEAYWFMTGTHPYRKDIEVPNRGRILAESLDAFEQDILPKFQKWAPNFRQWKKVIGHQGKWAGAILPNGSRFDVFTFDQKSKKLEGTSIKWCWANEPPPKSHVVASTRGLVDQDGDLYFTLTPLSEPYLYTDYVVKASKKNNIRIGMHTASIWDNPHLNKKAVKDWIETLDPDERQAREKGEFVHLLGRVFKTFKPDTHIIPTTDWPRSWGITIGIDPHLRKNQVAILLGRTNKGLYVAVDEITYEGNDLAEFGVEIVKRVQDYGYDIQKIMADSFLMQPDMVRRDIEPKKILEEIFKQAGLPNITIAKKKDTRDPFIMEMRRLLTPVVHPEYGMKDGKPIKYPGFVVMDRCSGLISDFSNYVFKSTRRPEITGESEEPIKKWDDYLDSLKYAFLADPGFETRIKRPKPFLIETYGQKRN